MKRALIMFAGLVLLMFAGGGAVTAEPFKEDWVSLEKNPVPQWLLDAKFGIYFHWGVYSVPAHWGDGKDGPPWAEWYGNRLTRGGTTRQWHEKTFGPLDKFGYQDLIQLFKAEKFDADAWAEVFRKSGAKFAGPVSIHHDGFAMWDSEVNRWNAAKMGPKKDLVGLLEKAIRGKGLNFICSMHHEQNQHFWKAGVNDPTSCVSKPEFADLYGNMSKVDFDKRWEAMVLELINKYHPDMLWFDGGLSCINQSHLKHFTAYYFNDAAKRGQAVTVAHKHNLPDTVGIVDMETHRYDRLATFPWIIDDTIDCGSWGHVAVNRKLNTKSADNLVDELADVVSKNGILQLNIGPKADGTLPDEQVESLLGLGKWLEVNGEAIYGTRTWRIAEDGWDVRFTRKGNVVYAIVLSKPKSPLVLKTFAAGSVYCPEEIAEISLLGKGLVTWTRGADGLSIAMPESLPNDLGFTFKITLKGRTCSELQATQADDGGKYSATAMINNYGDNVWSTSVRLCIDGKEVSARNVTVAAGQSQGIVFESTLPENGSHAVSISPAELSGRSPSLLVQTPRLKLAGEWKFHRDDDATWAKPDLDDSGWEKVMLPANWREHSKFGLEAVPGKQVKGWYRKGVEIPLAAKGHDLRLNLGWITWSAVVYVNGHEVGTSTWDSWVLSQYFDVPSALVNYGGPNTIAVCVSGGGDGSGGMIKNMGYVEFLTK